ncbi:MAG: cupredoxin domain-containing protein [Nitrospirales bacterium]|nr:cupredoxin domain-containing protein [Nitrospira sp.]MDR4499865.1 cupredoxin domain-containing protein [Nitrospirales bacterium]
MRVLRLHVLRSLYSFVIILSMMDHPCAAAQESKENMQETEISRTITLQMESYTFTPQVVQIDLGQSVQFLLKNESFLVPHNFLLDSPDGERLLAVNVDSGEQENVFFRPTQPGRYIFYCDKQLLFFPNHREEGMEGVLIVR